MQHDVRRSSGSSSVSSSRRASPASASTRRRRSTSHPAPRRAPGPTPGTFDAEQAAVRARRHRPGRGRDHAAADGARRRRRSPTAASMMRPHVAAEIRDDDGRTLVRRSTPKPWKTAMPPTTAATIRDFMVQVVAARHRYLGADRRRDRRGQDRHRADAARPCTRTRGSWRSHRPRPRSTRSSVIVERGGNMGNEATGGHVAAPIAGDGPQVPAREVDSLPHGVSRRAQEPHRADG